MNMLSDDWWFFTRNHLVMNPANPKKGQSLENPRQAVQASFQILRAKHFFCLFFNLHSQMYTQKKGIFILVLIKLVSDKLNKN